MRGVRRLFRDGAIAAAIAAVVLVPQITSLSTATTPSVAMKGTPSARVFTVAGLPAMWIGPPDERGLATSTRLRDKDAPPGTPFGAVAPLNDGSFLAIGPDVVWHMNRDGSASRAAGRGTPGPTDGDSGDGGLATRALLSVPEGVTSLPDGGFVIADTGNDRVRRVWPDGHISTVAHVGSPYEVAPLPDGGFLAAEPNGFVVQRMWPDGHVSMVAGNGQQGFSGDGGPATAARLDLPSSVGVLPDGGFLIADMGNNRIREVWPDGHISTVAGNGQQGFSGDGGPARSASLSEPRAVAVLAGGGFLISDTRNNRVREVWPDGDISTVAGNGDGDASGDGGPATAAAVAPYGLAVLPDGGFLIAERYNERVREVSTDGHISTVAGNGENREAFHGEGGPATAATLQGPSDVSALPDGGFLIADTLNNGIRRVWPDGHISTVAGAGDINFYGDGGPAADAQVYDPSGLAAMPDGGFLIGDTGNNRTRRVWPDGHISTLAGNGETGFAGDGGAATAARLNAPHGIAIAQDGLVLIADTGNNRVRGVWPDGHISTVAGNGRRGFGGDAGPATDAALNSPQGVAVLAGGGFLIADTGNNRIRRVWPDGHISTVAGNGHHGFRGDGGQALAASLNSPMGVAALVGGGFLIADTGNNRVRRVSPGRRISTFAGDGKAVGPVLYGNGGPPTLAALGAPDSVSIASDGNVLIGTGDSVRLVGRPWTSALLAVAIRSLQGVASDRGVRLRVGLTGRAHLTLRLYRSSNTKPVLTKSDFRNPGDSTFDLSSRHPLAPGVYAVDVRAQSRAQTVRTSLWVYIGRRLTTAFVGSLQLQEAYGYNGAGPSQPARARPAEPSAAPQRCRQMAPDRVDCVWGITATELSVVQASVLTRAGQIYAHLYDSSSGRSAPVFDCSPRWRGKPFWEDLSLVWH